ncbi:Yqey-like protein-domain-containing protein [Kickxella alabastrina]|uniref:Yqey-like protein-domain-containing protein n=1 Tax=Kickxella alabastrina TaxID=61397 RepID=UPI00221EE3FF|nr:Yqey-like protein-domain-containing protein [Kickxella alabastrina]KAI7830956.1 Yqey-like protein-domain-containing protein [Kickxella alabastrina]
MDSSSTTSPHLCSTYIFFYLIGSSIHQNQTDSKDNVPSAFQQWAHVGGSRSAFASRPEGAMKAKEKARLSVIKGVLSDILYAEKSALAGASFSRDSDSDVAGVIQRAIKQRHDSVQSYTEGGREDLAQAEALRFKYLPEQLSSEQIEARVRETIERLGVSGIKAMGTVMREVGIDAGQAPKSKVAEAVKKLLG